MKVVCVGVVVSGVKGGIMK